MVTVKTASTALLLTVCVLLVSPAGTVHDATALARLVTMVTAARKRVHDAGTMSPVTPKLGNVGGVILDGQDPGVYMCLLHT